MLMWQGLYDGVADEGCNDGVKRAANPYFTIW